MSDRAEAFRRTGRSKLGTNYGRRDDDPFWDAVHVLAPGEYETTLCGHSLDEVGSACSMDTGYKPGPGDGCWTCLERSNQWAEARS